MPQLCSEHTPLRTAQSDIWPIYVPSKGRPNSATLGLLRDSGLTVRAVVEPQEYEKYFSGHGKFCEVIALPQNNQGIAFVRNFIKDYARELARSEWYWMLDDDITQTYLVEMITREDNSQVQRLVKHSPLQVLGNAQRIFTRLPKVGQGALEYGQFAWSAKRDHAIGYCDVAVAIHTDRTKLCRYRPEMNLKEDRDFTLQVLTGGYLAVRASHCAFQAPKNGSNQGGLYDEYRAGLEEQASRRMEEAWPGICKFQPKKDGRPDVKVNWRLFKPSR